MSPTSRATSLKLRKNSPSKTERTKIQNGVFDVFDADIQLIGGHEIAKNDMVHGGGYHNHSGSASDGQDYSATHQDHNRGTIWGFDDGFDGWNDWSQWNMNQWGWWGPQYTDQNLFGVYTDGVTDYEARQWPSRSNDECSRCCRSCCLGICTCWFASSVAQDSPKCGPMSHWIFLSLCFFVLLVVMSNTDEIWTFNPGETRRVATRAILTSQIGIQSQVPNGIAVYDIKEKCPPLTGPTIPLDESMDLHLAPDDYQFDYFYLNEGSSLTVTFQQRRGATNLSLLKGMNQLRAIQGDEDYPSFASEALLTRYSASPCEPHHDASPHHKCKQYGPPITFSYVAPESDVYIIVYDNASSYSGRANTTIHVNLATFDLSNQTPYSHCQPLTCSVDTRRQDCLLLQAPSNGSIVTVHLTAKRRWLSIVSLSLLPLVIALGLQLCRRRRRRQGEIQEVMSPPATNPEAPLIASEILSVEYESIPIVADANVVPVAVPENMT